MSCRVPHTIAMGRDLGVVGVTSGVAAGVDVGAWAGRRAWVAEGKDGAAPSTASGGRCLHLSIMFTGSILFLLFSSILSNMILAGVSS